MEHEKSKLIFVYNADSGVFNLASDFAHKIFSPQTYACNLCAVTHGNFGMKSAWRDYLKTLQIPFEFLHADEFKTKYAAKNIRLPAVFSLRNGQIKQIINAESINSCRTIDDLKNLIDTEIEQII